MRIRALVAFAEKGREDFDFGRARVQRRDERLLEGDGAVVRAGVAPALQRMQRGDHPARALGGLVGVERAVDRVRHLRERLAEVEIGGRAVDGIPRRDHQRPHRAFAHLLAQVAERARAGVHLVEHGLGLRGAVAAQRGIDRMRDGVQHRGLARACRHQRALAGADQIFRQRVGEARAPGVEREPLRERRVTGERGHFRRQPPEQRKSESLHPGGLHPQPVIGVHAGDGKIRFHRVEPPHRAQRRVALLRPGPRVHQISGQRREEIRVERADHARFRQIDPRLVRAAEGELRTAVDLLQRDRAPRGEFRPRVGLDQTLPHMSHQRRRAGLHQKAQPFAALLAQDAVDGAAAPGTARS